jgi:hypothetical protein
MTTYFTCHLSFLCSQKYTKQAFVQSSLPSDETYFVRPPKGCHCTPPGTVWKLTWSLYGLRRAPRLWFEKWSSHLQAMGLWNSESSPCLFVGHLIEGEPPIYIGIYVDDIIYFSPSDCVEWEFESWLSTIGFVVFMGQVTHVLGIEFTWKHSADGHLCVSLTHSKLLLRLYLTLWLFRLILLWCLHHHIVQVYPLILFPLKSYHLLSVTNVSSIPVSSG